MTKHKPKLTETLAALTSHYANHPELPAWHSINVDEDGVIRVHLTVEDLRPASSAVITWTDTLTNPEVLVKRYKGGWAALVYDQVEVSGDINGQRITVHRGVPGFADYIDAPRIDTIGEAVFVQATVDQLRAFHASGLDEFEVAA
ncbi:hypothetical protein [Saccharopolyspora pogona]|uniref:hypothetical protein n=1 Tax=Saccharopolyspora pogona TaxID=333966 RepID=UPI001688B425|nr:hypothetical protein [Saccharopolyspora pogona]